MFLERRKALITAAAVSMALAGCSSSPTASDYANDKPKLDLKTYFNGTIRAHGMFSDRSGRVVRRFTVLMTCTWAGEDGVLDEAFTYADGSTERRVWRLKHLGDGRYTGRADDVVGEAIGVAAGNALQWRYVLKLPVDGRVWEVDFDDWMFLIDERVLLNRATMSKFGIRLGEVQLAFFK